MWLSCAKVSCNASNGTQVHQSLKPDSEYDSQNEFFGVGLISNKLKSDKLKQEFQRQIIKFGHGYCKRNTLLV